MIIHQVRATALDNPQNSLADFDLHDGSGSMSDTGERITREKALEYSPVYKSINLLSGDSAKLGCFIYRREGNGKVRATEHPAYQLLRNNPTPYMSAFNWIKQWVAHGVGEGNGYTLIERDLQAGGIPSELIVLNPDYVTPARINGIPVYFYESPGVSIMSFDAMDILHIHGLGWDGLCGYNLRDFARQSIGMGRASQKYVNKFYANDARPGIVLETPQRMDEQRAQQLLNTWNQRHGSLNGKHKAALISDGMKIVTLASAARDNQLIEGMTFSVRDVANWFNIPPHKLGDSSRAAYNSLEMENQSYLDEALDPWLVQMEQEFRNKLLTEDEKRNDSHVIAFNRKALLRADMATRGEFYNKATGGRAWLTPDEVRGAEDTNPMGGDAAKLMDPTNNFGGAGGQSDADSDDGDSASDQTPPPTDEDDDDRSALIDAAHRCWVDAMSRAVTRLSNQTARAAKSSADNWRQWVDSGIDGERQAVDAILAPARDMMTAICPDEDQPGPCSSLKLHIAKSCDESRASDRTRAVSAAIDEWQKEMLP